MDEDQILAGLSEQFHIPFEPDLGDGVDPALTTKVPISFIREYHMVPYKKNGTGYLVAVNDPVNLLPLDDLRLLLGGNVSPVLCRKGDIQKIIDGYFEQQTENAADMIDSITMSEKDADKYKNLETMGSERDLLDLANEAPIIKLINLVITGAVKERASDIHIEPFEKEVRVRYRIDGVLDVRRRYPEPEARLTLRSSGGRSVAAE